MHGCMMILLGTWIILAMYSFCVLGNKTCAFFNNNATIVKLENECVTLGVCSCLSDRNVVWRFNDKPIFLQNNAITTENLTSFMNNSLSIRSLEVSNEGEYSCFCSATLQKQYIVRVKVEPDFYISVDGVNYKSGTNVNFYLNCLQSVACHANGGKPPVNLIWLVNNEELESSKFNSTIVQNSERPHTWNSLCVLTNYCLTENDNITCVRGPQYSSEAARIWIKFQTNETTPSSANIQPCTTSITDEEERTFWEKPEAQLIITLVSVTLLILAVVVAVKYKMKRSRKTTNQPVEVYEEYSIAESPLMEISNISYARQGNTVVAAKNEIFLRRDCITLLSRLPSGGKMIYWTAVTSKDAPNKLMFVAKTLSESAQMKDLYQFKRMATQVKALTAHKNIVHIIDADLSEVPYYVYHQYEDGGTLRDFMLRNYHRRRESQLNDMPMQRLHQPLEDRKLELTRFALEAAEGMEFLRQNNFCHPAISSRKIILSRKRTCKLYDFVPNEMAQSRIIDCLEKKCPPLAWLPPEAIFLRQYYWQADIWSFAVVLWEIFSFGQTPYEGLTTEEIEKEIRCNRCLSQPLCCPGGVYSIMLSSWNVSFQERPTFSSITQQLTMVMSSFKEASNTRNDATEDPNYFILDERAFENDYDS